MEIIKIIVIEDDTKHLEDARNYSAQLNGCSIDFATTLTEASELLQKNTYDGVISDVFFPEKKGASADTFKNAITISNRLFELGIHHVFNTSGNHHGEKFRGFLWATPKSIHNDDRYHFLTTGMVIEAYPMDSNAQKEAKQWQATFRYILLIRALLQLPDKGIAIIEEVKFNGFPYGDYGELTEVFHGCRNDFILKIFQKFNA